MDVLAKQAVVTRVTSVDTIVGVSAWAREMRRQIPEFSRFILGVLISGPSGTGKELIARAVHSLSSRGDKPFIAVDCAAVVTELFPSHLFGSVSGAFTGARPSLGCFRAAAGGTLFFDEIGELDLHLQSQLLRVLQEKALVPVGCVHPIPVDVRIIAATSRDLHAEVIAGRFRRDLYHRLNVIELKTIPLKDRPEDIAGLARHFIQTFCQQYGLPVTDLSEAAELHLRAYDWPGNVRELRNVLERVLMISEGKELTPRCMSLLRSLATNDDYKCRAAGPPPVTMPPTGQSVIEPEKQWPRLDELEREHLRKTLEHTMYNQTAAAELLGITRRVLSRLMKKHCLDESRIQRPRPSSRALASGAGLQTPPKPPAESLHDFDP